MINKYNIMYSKQMQDELNILSELYVDYKYNNDTQLSINFLDPDNLKQVGIITDSKILNKTFLEIAKKVISDKNAEQSFSEDEIIFCHDNMLFCHLTTFIKLITHYAKDDKNEPDCIPDFIKSFIKDSDKIGHDNFIKSFIELVDYDNGINHRNYLESNIEHRNYLESNINPINNIEKENVQKILNIPNRTIFVSATPLNYTNDNIFDIFLSNIGENI
jgi:hypothetical protein